MDLRPRKRKSFSGFTKAEIEKMENLLKESKEISWDQEFYKKLAKRFNCSAGRAGLPVVKWSEVENWFRNRQQCGFPNDTLPGAPKEPSIVPEAVTFKKANESSEGGNVSDLLKLEFEARSSKDGAWYDVDSFVSHRFLSSGEAEVCVRFVGFGSEEDEWVSARTAVRERSIALENSECRKVIVGEDVLCFQEKKDQARYYSARIIEIERRLHDIRGCRCFFLIRYDHDNSEERVRLRRLCFRPNILGRPACKVAAAAAQTTESSDFSGLSPIKGIINRSGFRPISNLLS